MRETHREFIQDPSQQKTAEGLSPESQVSVPEGPLRSGDSKRAEFFAERIVYNNHPTVQKLSGTVQSPLTIDMYRFPCGSHIPHS